MISSKALELENSIQVLSLEEKLWLLEKIVGQVRQLTTDTNIQREEIQRDRKARPIWEVAVELGAKIPESEWEKVPSDLAKNFDFYQKRPSSNAERAEAV